MSVKYTNDDTDVQNTSSNADTTPLQNIEEIGAAHLVREYPHIESSNDYFSWMRDAWRLMIDTDHDQVAVANYDKWSKGPIFQVMNHQTDPTIITICTADQVDINTMADLVEVAQAYDIDYLDSELSTTKIRFTTEDSDYTERPDQVNVIITEDPGPINRYADHVTRVNEEHESLLDEIKSQRKESKKKYEEWLDSDRRRFR
jgi:hypothetical protein